MFDEEQQTTLVCHDSGFDAAEQFGQTPVSGVLESVDKRRGLRERGRSLNGLQQSWRIQNAFEGVRLILAQTDPEFRKARKCVHVASAKDGSYLVSRLLV